MERQTVDFVKDPFGCFLGEEQRYYNFQDAENKASDLQLMYCGKERCVPGHRYGPNKRNLYLLHVVYSGVGTLFVNGEYYHLSKGNAFLLYPHVEAWYEADLTEPWSYFWIGVRGVDADSFFTEVGFSKEKPVGIVHQMDNLLLYINKILQKQDYTIEEQLSRSAYMHLFFANLLRGKQEETHWGGPLKDLGSHSARVRAYLDEHYHEDISISALAKEMGIHRAHLFNSFKKDTGYSPKEYLLYIRMQNAKAMLRRTGKSIAEIAYMVGYHDPLSFSKIFRQKIGVSPLQYRNMKEEMLYNRETGEYLQHLY